MIAGTVIDDAGQVVAGASVWGTRKVGSGDQRFLNQLRGFSQEMKRTLPVTSRCAGLVPGDYILYASRGVGARAGSMRFGEGTPAKLGDTHVKIVLAADGGIQGTVALADGTYPPLFTVYAGRGAPVPFVTSDGHFFVTGLPTGNTSMHVEGPTFDPRGVDVTIAPGKIADVGTIVVSKSRAITGRVLNASGQPVPNANVIRGRTCVQRWTEPRRDRRSTCRVRAARRSSRPPLRMTAATRCTASASRSHVDGGRRRAGPIADAGRRGLDGIDDACSISCSCRSPRSKAASRKPASRSAASRSSRRRSPRRPARSSCRRAPMGPSGSIVSRPTPTRFRQSSDARPSGASGTPAATVLAVGGPDGDRHASAGRSRESRYSST